MQISVQLFSMFRHYAGVNQATVELDTGSTVADLLDALSRQFNNPVFSDDATLLMVMVNKRNAPRQTVLIEGDRVHLLPILGGG